MSFLKSGNLRESTGWIRQKLGPRNIQLLKTDGEVINELWLILEYYSEINEVGIKYLIANGIPRRKANNLFKHFQAYIRQAKNYYFSAQKLHQRSAALLYYYFFLNLAKAAILLNEPDIAGVRITHGIGCLPKNFKKIKNQTVKVLNDNGVFKKLYKFLFNIEITQQNISIKELFKYCSDISFQFKTAGYGESKLHPCYYLNIIDNRNRTAWPLIGIHNFSQISKYKKSLNNLFSNFEQVTLPEELGIQYFKVSKMELSSLTFFQSKITLPWIGTNIIPSDECRNLVMNTIKPIYQFNYFDDDFDFLIVSPYQTKRQLVLDETSAIYLIMFYLSNLVRYNPSYLEELLSKKEAWIIESFIKTCSLTFLRAMVSRIVNVDYIIGKR